MNGDERRGRILAAVGSRGPAAGGADVLGDLCRFAVERLHLSGCALLLGTSDGTLDVVASAGAHAEHVAELQFSLGEGPCLDAARLGHPVFAVDLAGRGARWPVFASRACDAGVLAEFSLPLQVGPVGLGALDLSRNEPGMLGPEDLSDALVAADLATDAVLMLQRAAAGADLADALRAPGSDRLVVHQATGMVSVQLDVSTDDALASLRAAAFRSGRSLHDLAEDVVKRRLTLRG